MRRLLAEPRAVVNEYVPWVSETGEIDVDHEAPVVAVDQAGVARRHDQAAHVVAKDEPCSRRQVQKQLGTVPLVRAGADLVDGIVEPQRELDRIAIVQQRRHLVEAAHAIPDVVQIVKAPIRRPIAAAQLGIDRPPVG